MNINDDLLGNLKKFILEQNNIQTDKLIDYVDSRITEFEKIIKQQVEKTGQLELELQQVKEKNEWLERKLNQNKIIIFNLGYTEGDLLNFTISKLNSLLKLPKELTETDINDIYTIGKSESKPIIIHFVRYLVKHSVLKSCKNLKGTSVSISEVLSKIEQEENKNLRTYLKQAKDYKLKARIYKNKLYIDDKPFTVSELKSGLHVTGLNIDKDNSSESESEEPQIDENNENFSKKRKLRSSRRRKNN